MQDEEWAERVGRMGRAAAGERPWPGCTAIVLLVHAGRLYVANAGDCRAVLCRDVRFKPHFLPRMPLPPNAVLLSQKAGPASMLCADGAQHECTAVRFALFQDAA